MIVPAQANASPAVWPSHLGSHHLDLINAFLSDSNKDCAAMACVNRELRQHSHTDGAWRQRLLDGGYNTKMITPGTAREFYQGLVGVDPRVNAAKLVRSALITTVFLDRLAFTLPEASLGVVTWTVIPAWLRSQGIVCELGVPSLVASQATLFALNQYPISTYRVHRIMRATEPVVGGVAALVAYGAIMLFFIEVIAKMSTHGEMGEYTTFLNRELKILPIGLSCVGGVAAHFTIAKVARVRQLDKFGIGPMSFVLGYVLGTPVRNFLISSSTSHRQEDVQAQILAGVIFGSICWIMCLLSGARLAHLTRRKIRIPIAMAAGRATFRGVDIIQKLAASSHN